MYTYRSVQPSDWNQVINLVNRVFQEKIRMETSFPLLFNPTNTFSYVATDKDRIIGFIGVVPEELRIEEKTFYGVRIGAVCTDEEYQGKGIGRAFFKYVKKELVASKMDFALVSGQGKLYISEGCEMFGEFSCFEMTKPVQKERILIQEFTHSLEELRALHSIIQKKDSQFVKSINEFQIILQAHPMSNLQNSKQLSLIGVFDGKQAAIIANQSLDDKSKTINIIEFGGCCKGILQLMNQLQEKNPDYTIYIRPSKKSKLKDYLSGKLISKSEENAGTILYFNEELRQYSLPHTWDMAFL